MSKYELEVLNTVSLRGTVGVRELAKTLGVSDQTVRRIVKPMVERGEVRKVHGAIVSARPALDPPFLARMNLNRAAKAAIARAVTEIIEDGDSVAIDTGSTSAFVAQSLRVRRHLTVVTNSAFVASTLAMIEGNHVFMAGTQLRDHDGAAFDRSTFEVIERMQADHAILSASMVDPANGFLVHEQCEVDVATAMTQIAARTVMAVDHSKFEQQARRPIVKQPALRQGDVVVTDRRPDAAFENLFRNVELRLAAPG